MNNEPELRYLAVKGLEISEYQVQTHITNNRRDITTASLNVFKDWKLAQNNDIDAFVKMCKALKKCNMNYYISAVLEKN